MHNVWVLPGHILVSLDEGHKLLAYDFSPKQNPWPNTHDFMVSSHSSRRKGNKNAHFLLIIISIVATPFTAIKHPP